MRILHVAPAYLPAIRYGGPSYSVHALCKALAQLGHDVHVYTTNVDGPSVSAVPVGEVVELDGVKVTYFELSHGQRLIRSPQMGKALNETVEGFDVIHLHTVFLWPTTAAAAAARRHRVPYVLAPRGMLVAELIRAKSRLLKSAWIHLFERRNLAHAAAVHVTSQIEADGIAALGLPMPRVAVIPNGIEMPPAADAGAGGASGCRDLPRPFVLSLGRINWKKGLDRLILAMVHVPDTRLVIAGNDEEGYQPVLEALAHEHGIEERVHFAGPVHGEEKWDLIRSAAVFALPSYNENFGNAVLEAMACGVPVVVTPEVGLADAVATAGAGVVTAGDQAMLSAAIRGLLADPDGRRRMGEGGRTAALEIFSWNAAADATERLYRDLVPETSTKYT